MADTACATAVAPEVRDAALQKDVLRGLASRPKALPSKYFYDARGSELFERICAQPEYYLTRTELDILRRNGPSIARSVGRDALVLEYGSGSGVKTELLLDALDAPVAYVPVEISETALRASVSALQESFPEMEMLPLCADFNAPVSLPQPAREPASVLLFFPGSTIGNFDAAAAEALLRVMQAEIGDDGAALVGIDLQKDPALIEAAYNDAAGVTAAFTLNLLQRLNRDLGADFDIPEFRHRARYDVVAGRIETHIVSRREQRVTVCDRHFDFAADEAMHVEYSCKYSLRGFAEMAQRAGLEIAQHWTDPAAYFALVLLRRRSSKN